jgi:hypothetical protein
MSPRMKFEYRKFPAEPSKAFPRRFSAIRPVIPVTLINGDKRVNYLSIIDSGADLCIFPTEIGEQIGIKAESGIPFPFYGIGGIEFMSYIHNIKLGVGGYEFDCRVGFSKDIEELPYGLLGQMGFFSVFNVAFDYNKEIIELKSKENT